MGVPQCSTLNYTPAKLAGITYNWIVWSLDCTVKLHGLGQLIAIKCKFNVLLARAQYTVMTMSYEHWRKCSDIYCTHHFFVPILELYPHPGMHWSTHRKYSSTCTYRAYIINVPFNAPGVESHVTEELRLLKVVLSLVIGGYVGMNPKECVESSGATLLGSNHQQRGKTGTVLARRPNLYVTFINTRGL